MKSMLGPVESRFFYLNDPSRRWLLRCMGLRFVALDLSRGSSRLASPIENIGPHTVPLNASWQPLIVVLDPQDREENNELWEKLAASIESPMTLISGGVAEVKLINQVADQHWILCFGSLARSRVAQHGARILETHSLTQLADSSRPELQKKRKQETWNLIKKLKAELKYEEITN